MSRRRRRRFVLAVATGLLLLAPVVPAHADGGRALDNGWNSPPCATGEITNYYVEPTEPGSDTFIRMAGWSALCPPQLMTQEPYEFGLVLYSQTRGWIGRLSEYAPGGGPTAFSYRVNHTDERVYGPIVAACLAYGRYDRLSCLAVDFTHTPFLVRISVDDPRVSGRPVDAVCPSCA